MDVKTESHFRELTKKQLLEPDYKYTEHDISFMRLYINMKRNELDAMDVVSGRGYKIKLSQSQIIWLIGELDYCGYVKETGNPKQNPNNDYGLADEIQRQVKKQGLPILESRCPDTERKYKGE